MRRNYFLMLTVLFLGLTFCAKAQDSQIIAGWSFLAEGTSISSDALYATSGTKANIGVSAVATSMKGQKFNYTKSNKSIYCNGWHNESGVEKYWIIGPVSLEGFNADLALRYQGWGTKTSPKTFYYEYRIGKNGDWKRIGSYDLTTVAKTWVGPLSLPAKELGGQKDVFFRFLVAGNTPIDGDTIASGGNSRLAEIAVIGTVAATDTQEPTFDPEGGSFFSPFDMTISCANKDAVIYYTLDGTTPTDSTAKRYDGKAIRIDTTTTVKAFAVATGLKPSKIVEVEYVYAVPKVRFTSLEDGGTYKTPIFLRVDVDNFRLYQDGEGDGFLKFESPIIDVFAEETGLDTLLGIKNPVYCDQGMFDTMSEFPIIVKSGTYTITASLVNKDSADFVPAYEHTITVTIVDSEIITLTDTAILPVPGIEIPFYVQGVGLTEPIKVECADSLFQVSSSEDNTPVENNDSEIILLHPEDENVLNLVYLGHKDTMVNAILTLTSGDIVKEVVLNYGLGWDSLPNPVFSIPEGVYSEAQTVAITCPVENVFILYTTDGSDPIDSDDPQLYTEPIVVSSTTIINAYAFAMNAYPSEVVTAKYVIETTGLSDENVAGVRIYPNPTTSLINIELGDATARKVDVIAMNGQVVYMAENKGNNFDVSLNDCANGTYIIRVVTSNNEIIVRKVMKK